MKGEGLILVNGEPVDSLNVMDRGLQYGDGVFRTLKVDSGRLCWWKDHYAKLHQDCHALRIQCPEESLLEKEASQIAAQAGIGVVKILVTRGAGPRGYRMAGQAEPTRIVMGFAAGPVIPESVEVRWCDLKLSHQPLLAGIKHLNRLENVLARSEWQDPDIAEGLMLDESGHVICGTMTNLVIVEDGNLVTPDLSLCGVAGVTRNRLMRAARKYGQTIRIDSLAPERLLAAGQVLLCNSLVGIWRVEKLGDTVWPDNGWAAKLKCWLNEDH